MLQPASRVVFDDVPRNCRDEADDTVMVATWPLRRA
jgi:hypothetical protein